MISIKPDIKSVRKHDLAVICGDGRTLPQELQTFRLIGIKHDAFCVGRALQCYVPFVAWEPAAINYVWLDEQMFTYARDQVDPPVVRHSVFFDDKLKPAIDVLWTWADGKEVMEWDGSSAFFALQMAIQMEYPRIMLAGVPLNAEPHWYDSVDDVGPMWTPETLRAWGRFRKYIPRSRIRSCSGYTQYLFGEPTIGWLNGEINTRATGGQGGGGATVTPFRRPGQDKAEGRV
jgi:hypothetical protein